MVEYWETVYAYFRGQKIPDNILGSICISSSEAEQISTIIEKTLPRTILEIGTFIGLSTGVIALASAPESTFVCVDPNLPVEMIGSHYRYADKRGTLVFVRQMLKHFGQDQRTILLEGFFSHLSDWARERITACGNDPEQAVIIGEDIGKYAPYDLVFLDGDHNTDAVSGDLSLLARFMSPDGIIVLHDVIGLWGEQTRAGVAQFIEEHPGFSLKTDHNLGFLSRDTEKAWLVPYKAPSIAKRVKRKAALLLNR